MKKAFKYLVLAVAISLSDCNMAEANSLTSWTLFPDIACRYFSGTARYSISFENRTVFKQAKQLMLDLGDVREMATIYLLDKL